jgi:hypothetical protein
VRRTRRGRREREYAGVRLDTRSHHCGVRGEGLRAGDEAQKAAAESGEELWRCAHYDTEAPFTETEISKLYTDLGERLREIHQAEVDAIGRLAAELRG